eukprot:scaffold1902_cov80-Skeletonema_marinoi.AAC.8
MLLLSMHHEYEKTSKSGGHIWRHRGSMRTAASSDKDAEEDNFDVYVNCDGMISYQTHSCKSSSVSLSLSPLTFEVRCNAAALASSAAAAFDSCVFFLPQKVQSDQPVPSVLLIHLRVLTFRFSTFRVRRRHI